MPNAAKFGADDERLFARIRWRLMPLVVASMMIATIDRSNIGFAKLGMAGDLRLGDAAFAFGSSVFYIGYIMFEIPSALANYRFGTRKWITRIMISWGIITILLAFCTNATVFYLLRFALGAAEAGLYPSLVFYLTLWFPQHLRIRAMAILTIGSALGNGLSALISGSLLDLDGFLGAAGWQWIFLVTGTIPLIIAMLIFIFLPSRPADAKFLTATEIQRVTHLVGDHKAAPHTLSPRTFLQARIAGFGLLYAIFLGSIYGTSYWVPTVFAQFNVTGAHNGLMSAAPWAFDALLLIAVSSRLKAQNHVHTALLVLAILGLVSFGTASFSDSLLVKVMALLVGIPAVSIGLACFWTVPVRHFRGVEGAAAIGAISMIGNFGGVVALNLMPAIARVGNSPSAALWAPSAGMFVIAIWALILRRGDRANEALEGAA